MLKFIRGLFSKDTKSVKYEVVQVFSGIEPYGYLLRKTFPDGETHYYALGGWRYTVPTDWECTETLQDACTLKRLFEGNFNVVDCSGIDRNPPPKKPSGSLVEASKEQGNPCNGCWFVDEKPNWVDDNIVHKGNVNE